MRIALVVGMLSGLGRVATHLRAIRGRVLNPCRVM